MHRRCGLAIAASLFALSPSPAGAQENEEIIVTASKRGGADPNDLPIAMNAFSERDLEARNAETLQSLSYVMPNVQFEDVGTARGVANLSIRGVGVNSSIASVDPAVGLFKDGMYIGLNAGALTPLFDAEAVEVLRGPQGTLYGRNVTGGAVLVRSNRPSDEFRAHASASYESGPKTIVEGALSGALLPGLTGRFAGLIAHDEGWFTNESDGASFGENDAGAARLSLRLAPDPRFETILRLEHGRQNGDGPAGQNHALFARGGFDFSIDNPGYARTIWSEATLEANWRVAFGDGVVTTITGWRDVEVPWAADIDSTPNWVFHTRVLNLHDQFSQEVRYAGRLGSADLVGGLYYLDQNLTYIDERNFSPTFRRTGGGEGHFVDWAAFANADWRLSAGFSLSAGLRFTHEAKDSRISRVRRAEDNLDGAESVPGEGFSGGSIDARTLNSSDAPFAQSWDDLSPRLGVQWRPNSRTNVYASWSRAFRGGGANFRTSSLGLAPRAYEPEEQSTFEFGWKQQFERGRINLALFHNSIQNMQRETNLADPVSGVQQVVLNAGDAAIYGGEIEARWDVSESFSISAQAGYAHGAYDRVTEDLNGDLVVNDADRRQRIPRLAPWTYGLNLEYDAPFAGGLVEARLGYNHRDSAYYNDTNLGRLDAIDFVDANVAYAPEGAGWRLALYGMNLLNEASWGGDTTLPSTAAFGYSGAERPTFSPLNKGRVIGVELSWRHR